MSGKFVLLRAKIKQTEFEYEGQIAKNDDFYEDVATSSDYWLVFADHLRKYFSEVELWYQADPNHPKGIFTHSTGLVERFCEKDFMDFPGSPDVLFVRGDHKEYYSVITRTPFAQRIYYPSGPYYIPNSRFEWDTCFVEDERQVRNVHEATGAYTFLFRKSCVEKYFINWNEKKKYDLCVVCNAPTVDRKRLYLLKEILKGMKSGTTALVIGLTGEKVLEEFKQYPVTFSGFINRKEIGKYMNQCRVGLVLSSAKGDGSPRVFQEFLASDVPVVTTEEAVYSSYYINGLTGRSARVPNSLAKIITKVLENMDQYSPRKYFLEELNMEKSVKQFMSNIGRI